MSLRAARSLPCLRSAFQQSIRDTTNAAPPALPKINIQQFSTSQVANALKSSNVNTMTAIRNVHQTTQKKATLLTSKDQSIYSSMNLQALKTECRNRGIKISGKKLDLIQRLTLTDVTKASDHLGSRNLSSAAEKKITTKQLKDFQKKLAKKLSTNVVKSKETPAAQVKSFSTAKITKAKGDVSTVDDLKFPSVNTALPPVETEAPSLIPKDPVKKIDVIETKTKIADMEGAVSVGGDNEGEVTSFQNMFKDFKIDEAAGLKKPAVKFEPSTEEVPQKDKLILGGILGGIALWWSLKPKKKA